jgi:CDP-diacylglycerol---glycerol-3-phosphate 3-phosphatidyltransferase
MFSHPQLPNILTAARVVMIPVVIYGLAQQTRTWDWIAAIVFGVAGITDYFDGYLARRYKLETIFGKLLDPLADKFLVVCSAVMLQQLGRLSPYLVMILICRELAITGLRAVASAEGLVIAASPGGKWKTTVQMFSIPFLMVSDDRYFPFFKTGTVLLYLSLVISLWSASVYVRDFFVSMREKKV